MKPLIYKCVCLCLLCVLQDTWTASQSIQFECSENNSIDLFIFDSFNEAAITAVHYKHQWIYHIHFELRSQLFTIIYTKGKLVAHNRDTIFTLNLPTKCNRSNFNVIERGRVCEKSHSIQCIIWHVGLIFHIILGIQLIWQRSSIGL